MELFDYLLAKKNSGGGGSDIDWSVIGYDTTPSYIYDDYNYAIGIQETWDSSITNLSSKYASDNNLVIFPLVDTSNATSMSSMFTSCINLKAIPQFNTLNVSNMQQMFYKCNNLTEIPQFDTSNVTNTQGMFQSCTKLISIPLLDTNKVTYFNNMFKGCTSLVTVPVLDTSSIKGMSDMFADCLNLSDTTLDNILQMCINANVYTSTKTLVTLGIRNSTTYPTSRIEALSHYQEFINAGWTIGY